MIDVTNVMSEVDMLQKTVLELRAERDRWRQIAIKEQRAKWEAMAESQDLFDRLCEGLSQEEIDVLRDECHVDTKRLIVVEDGDAEIIQSLIQTYECQKLAFNANSTICRDGLKECERVLDMLERWQKQLEGSK